MGLDTIRYSDEVEVDSTIELSLSPLDADGNPVDPLTLDLLIVKPDGTTDVSAIGDFTNPSVGLYELRYKFDQAGKYEWTALAETPAVNSSERVRGAVLARAA